jgi:beta-glucosidase
LKLHLSGNASLSTRVCDKIYYSDAVIAVVGGDTQTCGEGFDRKDLGLPGSQEPLLQAIRRAVPHKQLIVVLLNGRPLSVEWIANNVDALVEGYNDAMLF